MTPSQHPIDRQEKLEEARRLMRAVLDAMFPIRLALTLTPDVSDDGDLVIEIGDGDAALEPVEVTVNHGLGCGSHQALYWRVYQQVDASDRSVGLYGTELQPAPLEGRGVVWQLPGRLTAALSHDLGVSDDVLHHHLARHNLVVARVWGQDGCYAFLNDAVCHIVRDLVERTIDPIMEQEAISIDLERGEKQSRDPGLKNLGL